MTEENGWRERLARLEVLMDVASKRLQRIETLIIWLAFGGLGYLASQVAGLFSLGFAP